MLDFRVHKLPPQLRVHSAQTIRSTIAEAKMSFKCAGDRGIGKDHRIPLAELLSPKRRNPSPEVTKAVSPVSTDRGWRFPDSSAANAIRANWRNRDYSQFMRERASRS